MLCPVMQLAFGEAKNAITAATSSECPRRFLSLTCTPAAARFAIAGTADDCRERVAALVAAGVEQLVLSPIAAHEEYDEQLAGLAEALLGR